jgi:hypothetical protein
MSTRGSCGVSGSLIAAIVAAATLNVSAAQTPLDLDAALARIGNRIEEFYKRVQSLMCVEKVTAQAIRSDLSMEGFARVLEYDLRVEAATDGDGESSDANFVRELRKVNGRVPRERELNDRNTCLDPNPLSPEPLAFLLAKNRGDFVFTWGGYGKGKEQNLFLIDYKPVQKEKALFVEDKKGRDGCFQISLPTERKRLWVDAQTYDVVRIEEHLASRVDIRVPIGQQRRNLLPDVIVVDRFDLVTRYKPVAFQNPDETLLLPASIEQIAVLHGAQSNRKTQVFSNYKRFLTGGRIIKE